MDLVQMPDQNHVKECQEHIKKLEGRKVMSCSFKAYENNCWRFYIVTDKGKLVMTFCPNWACPVVEHHEAHHDDVPEH
ncbi:MAG: hypothetical protein ACOX08_08605 [Methanobacterium sp.]|jgi:hypothetical protein